MARAKRTARADARRRYRAEHAPIEGDEFDDELDDDESAPTPSSKAASTSRAASGSAPAGPARMSIGTAFRLAFRPLDVRADLAGLPDLAIHTKAIWLPVLIVIASVAAIAVMGIENILTGFLYVYFIQTPAIGVVFLAGFLAPRASWLAGAIVGVAAALGYAVLMFVFPSSLFTTPPTPAQLQAAQAEAATIAISSLILTPIMGGFFAAAAAWYRRFLQFTNPNRGRRTSQSKPARHDGRARSTGSQKAGVRR